MTVDLFPPCVTDRTPEIGTDIEEICNEIHQACKGFGTKEQGTCDPSRKIGQAVCNTLADKNGDGRIENV